MNPNQSEPTDPRSWPRWPLALLVLAVVVVIGGAFALMQSDLIGESSERANSPPVTGENRSADPEAVEPDVALDDTATGDPKLTQFTLASAAVGRDLPVSVLEPGGGSDAETEGRPLLVFLHGAGGSHETSVGDPALLEALEEIDDQAPVIAFPDGQMSWWRERPDGDWGRYVAREVIPAVMRRYYTDRHRVAIGGISMGGYGAYHLGLTYPRRFCAVGGHSAGLYLDYEESSFGSFDSPTDFRRNDIVANVKRNPDAFGNARIWNDYGDQDWFVEGNAAFVDALERGSADLTANVWPGGHDGLYWSEHWPDYLEFYSESLAGCDR